MPQYWIAIHHPDDAQMAVLVDASMRREIDALNDQMHAAGVRVFAGGLQPPRQAMTLSTCADGRVITTPGARMKAAEYVGGLWVLELENMDQAMVWASKALAACKVPVEVRPFY